MSKRNGDRPESRFSYLEVDGPSRAEIAAREEAAEEATHAREQAERAHAEATEIVHLSQIENARHRAASAAREEAEAIERRNAAVSARGGLRKARAAAARARKNAKDRANNSLHKLNYNHYWQNKGDGMAAMKKAATDAGYELTGEIWNEHHDSTDQGRLSYALVSPDGDGEPIGLHIQWYRMGSGKWELNAYVN